MKAFLLALLLCSASLAAAPSAPAQEAALDVSADAIKVNLERQVGKRVRLRLLSGQDVDGTVVAVGAAAVHMSRLAGMDFFDGVVRLDQIAAVIIRVRGN